MVNPNVKRILAFTFVIGALVLIVGSMATLGWAQIEHTQTQASREMTTIDKIGLLKYHNEVSVDGKVVVETDGDSKDRYSNLGDIGTHVIVIGSITATLSIVAMILYSCGQYKVRNWMRYVAIIFIYVSAGLILLGTALYAQKWRLDSSYHLFTFCCLIYLTGASILASSGSVLSVRFNRQHVRTIVALLLLLGAAIGTIAAMATEDWIVAESNTATFHIGLKTYTATDGHQSKSGDVDAIPEIVGLWRNLADTGRNVIICGSIALVVWFMSGIIYIVGEKKERGLYKFIGILGYYICAGLMILGNLLYCDCVYLNYSYIIWTSTSLLYLAAASLFVSSETEQTGRTRDYSLRLNEADEEAYITHDQIRNPFLS